MVCRFVSEVDKEWFKGCMMKLVEQQLGAENRAALEQDDVFVDFMRSEKRVKRIELWNAEL